MNDLYRYHNQNPEKIEEEDCVCRAISTAVGISYGAAQNLINLSAEVNGCDTLCVCCYHHLLEDLLELDRYNCDFRYTVGEIAKDHPRQRLIIRVEGHLTCAMYGVVLDIWDCTREMVDCFWVV